MPYYGILMLNPLATSSMRYACHYTELLAVTVQVTQYVMSIHPSYIGSQQPSVPSTKSGLAFKLCAVPTAAPNIS